VTTQSGFLRRPQVKSAVDALLVVGLLALVFAFYLWTASSSGNPIRFSDGATDYFNLQADAYLDGDLRLPIEPGPELLALPNPYDPVANAPYRVHDLALYEGEYFLPWGPTPALTLFIPFRVLPFGDMPENLAVVLFAFAGLVFSLLTLRFLVRRFFPATPRWIVLVAGAALAFGNVAPFVLRRPAVYEVAISAGYCFSSAALYLLLSGALAARASPLRLGLGSLCLGLALGARPNLVVAGLGLVAVWLYLVWRRRALGRLRAALLLFGPVTVCGALLLVHNYARFDKATEFGLTYQLAGVETRTKETFEAGYVVPGLYFYLLAPARLSLDFPYVHLPPPPGYPGDVPAGYDGVEITGGVVPTLPIVLVLLPVAVLAARGRLQTGREVWAVIAGLALVGVAIIATLSWALWGTTMRYEMDFASFLLLAALLAWLALLWSRRASLRGRRLLAAGGTALVAWGALVGVAISMTGYYDSLRTGEPGTYRALERFFSPLPTLVTMAIGRPVLVDVLNPNGYGAAVTYGTAGAGAATFAMNAQPTTIEIVAPKDEVVGLEATVRRGGSAALGSRLVVTATSRDNDGTARHQVRDGPARIPISVGRGWNEIELQVTETPPTAEHANPLAQLVLFEDLHVTAGANPNGPPDAASSSSTLRTA
jgi:hypothetical protein